MESAVQQEAKVEQLLNETDSALAVDVRCSVARELSPSLTPSPIHETVSESVDLGESKVKPRRDFSGKTGLRLELKQKLGSSLTSYLLNSPVSVLMRYDYEEVLGCFSFLFANLSEIQWGEIKEYFDLNCIEWLCERKPLGSEIVSLIDSSEYPSEEVLDCLQQVSLFLKERGSIT